MVITKTAVDEFSALPVHSRAKVIHCIDRYAAGATSSTFIKLRDDLVGIYTGSTGIQRIIFFYEQGAQNLILGVLMRKNKIFTQSEQGALMRRVDGLCEQETLTNWTTVRHIALDEPEVKSAFENEVLKENLQTTLLEWRSSAGLTREQLAEKMGVSYKHICNMEINPSKVSIHTIYQYARMCDIDNPTLSL